MPSFDTEKTGADAEKTCAVALLKTRARASVGQSRRWQNEHPFGFRSLRY